MSLNRKINNNKDITLTNTLRLILAAVKDKDISARSKSNSEGINETEIISLLQNMIKQRNASIEMYIQGKRDDLVKIEEDEIKEVLDTFELTSSSDDDDDQFSLYNLNPYFHVKVYKAVEFNIYGEIEIPNHEVIHEL